MNLATFSIKTNFGCSGVVEYTGSASLPTSVALPNGRSYTIEYEDTPGWAGYKTGRVKKVTLPTGGYYEYTHPAPNNGINCADGTVKSLTRVIHDGTSATWTFARSPLGSDWKTAVTAPQLLYDATANQTVFIFNSSAKETTQYVYQGSEGGALLQTVTTSWAANGTPSVTTVVLENSQQSKTESTFDDFGNLTQSVAYDWGSGAPGPAVRTTQMAYLATAPYTARNIRNRPTEVKVREGGPAGAVKSRTDIDYDASGLAPCPSGVPQHDTTNYPCTFTTRGNPTTVTRFANAAAGTGARTQALTYDSLGNLRSATDPGGHTTSLDYADNFTDGVSRNAHGYVTTVTLPPTGAVSHVERRQFYWPTGLVAATCGQNFPAASPCTNGYTPPQSDYARFTYDVLGRLLTAVQAESMSRL